MILGHEVAGTIEAVGPGVTGLAPGDGVAVSPSRPCGVCEYCLRGMPNHCLAMRFYGSAMPFPHVQGAFRQVLLADAAQCVPTGTLDLGVAATAEPLAVALHAVRQAGDIVGRTVLVTGCGPIGCLAILAARRAGAGRIVATDLTAFCRDMALRVGADEALDAADAGALTGLQAGKGQVDVHFECSGAAPALAFGISALRPRGVLVQLGLGGDMTVPMQALTAREITLRGSFRFHEEFAMAVGMLRGGLIDPAPMLTQRFPVEDVQAAFDKATDRSDAMKVQIAF
jgi:L-idonate 5-dehydrogenase